MKIQEKKAFSFLLIGTISFGFSSIFIKLCNFPSSVIATFRILIAGIIIFPFCYRDLKGLPIGKLLILFVPGLLLGMHFQFWVAGIKTTLVATGTFIFSINPIFFAIATTIVFKEKPGKKAVLALTLVLAGSIWLFIVKAGFGSLNKFPKELSSGDAMGAMLCFISMILFVLYLTAVKKFAGGLPHLVVIHIIYLWGGILTLPIAILTGDIQRVNPYDISSLLFLLALVILPTLIGHTSNNYAVRYFSPLFVSFFSLAEPIFSSINAYIFLHETPDILEYPAYAVFIISIVIYILSKKRLYSDNGNV